MAPPCQATVTLASVPEATAPEAALSPVFAGIRVLPLPGHFFGQQGYFADGVLFAGDALFGADSIAKHPVFFVYDVAAFLASLDSIAAAAPAIVLPSHGHPVHGSVELANLIAVNRDAIDRVASTVLEACSPPAGPATPDEVLACVCARFGITLDWAQYALVGSTVRSYLVYLRENGKLTVEFRDGKMVWGRNQA
jgi:glyoxylase-like metal-dependent hydrolase (beta-lactamase superfamily II)